MVECSCLQWYGNLEKVWPRTSSRGLTGEAATGKQPIESRGKSRNFQRASANADLPKRYEALKVSPTTEHRQRHHIHHGQHTSTFRVFPLSVPPCCTRATPSTTRTGSAEDTSTPSDPATTSSGELITCCTCADTITARANMGRHIEGSTEEEDESYEEAT